MEHGEHLRSLSSRSGRVLAAVLAAGVILVVVGAARAAAATPSWLPPTAVGPQSRTGFDVEWPPYVAIDGQGNTTAVWTHEERTEFTTEAASRQPGGPWEASVPLSATGGGFSAVGGIALDAAGDATAIWIASRGSDRVVQAATKPVGGAWGAAVDLSFPGATLRYPRIAVDAAGDAVAAWSFGGEDEQVVQVASRPAGGTWGAPVAITGPGQPERQAQVAIDDGGNATAVWVGDEGIESTDRPAGGTWSQPVSVSGAEPNVRLPQVAVDPAGDATAVWSSAAGLQGASRAAGGSWGPSTNIASGRAERSELALADDGSATVVWEGFEEGTVRDVVKAAVEPAGGAWGAPVELSAAGSEAIEPQLAVEPGGDAVAVWRTFDAATERSSVVTARKPAGGEWGAPVDLSGAARAFEPAIAVNAEGEAAAAWYDFEVIEGGKEGVYTPEVAGYDAAPPRLSALSIPERGTAGEPTPFSVSAIDVWSGVAQTTWSFGDGSSATGAAVTHAYSRPGTYPVTVTSTDALGFTSSASGSVEIGPAPVAPPAPSPASGAKPLDHLQVRILHRPHRRRQGRGNGHPRYAFRFFDATPGATYQCSLDRAPFKPCGSPKIYRHLTPGKHVFRVRSVDAQGTASAVRRVRFVAAGKRG